MIYFFINFYFDRAKEHKHITWIEGDFCLIKITEIFLTLLIVCATGIGGPWRFYDALTLL